MHGDGPCVAALRTPLVHHNLADGIMVGAHVRGRDHMSGQEAGGIQGPGSLFIANQSWELSGVP